MRWTRRIGLGLLAVLVVLVLGVYVMSSHRMNRVFDVPEAALLNAAFVPDSSLVRAGERLATIRGCNDCHGLDLGGRVLIDDPMFGRVVPPNLTPGGATDTFSLADWDRAIRHGVRPDGKGYLIMPAHEMYLLSDEDLSAIVAYLRQLPPAHHDLPSNSVRPLGRALYLAGVLPLVPAELVDHDAARPAPPVPGPTPEYGHYLAIGCTGCHGADYGGGIVPGTSMMAANLTADPETGLGTWTLGDFEHALRSGERPDGSKLDPAMPIAATKMLNDTEVAAIWAFLQTVPPVSR